MENLHCHIFQNGLQGRAASVINPAHDITNTVPNISSTQSHGLGTVNIEHIVNAIPLTSTGILKTSSVIVSEASPVYTSNGRLTMLGADNGSILNPLPGGDAVIVDRFSSDVPSSEGTNTDLAINEGQAVSIFNMHSFLSLGKRTLPNLRHRQTAMQGQVYLKSVINPCPEENTFDSNKINHEKAMKMSDVGCGNSNEAINTEKAKVYQCHLCKSTFSSSYNLKSHSLIHLGEKPFTCETCGASFNQKSNLKSHKRIHTGERPFQCSECGQSFLRSSHLTGHSRIHTGERPYICGVCGKDFGTSTHMRNHMRKHSNAKPFQCSICDKAFTQRITLRVHLRVHSGERPFTCPVCGSAFRSRGDMRSHLKLHTDKREFFCGRCAASFKTKSYLTRHEKKCGVVTSHKKRGRPRKSAASGNSNGQLDKDINIGYEDNLARVSLPFNTSLTQDIKEKLPS